MDPTTRRKFFRITFARHADMEFARRRYDGCQIRDLSLHGMFVTGDFIQRENDPCLVSLVQKSRTTDLRIQALAKVIRKEGQGIALAFTSMPFESYMYLQTVLLSHTKNLLIMEKMLEEDCPFSITDEATLSLTSATGGA